MTNILLRDHRQLIPRWHTSRKAYRLLFPSASMAASTATEPVKDFKIEISVQDWRVRPSISSATDLLVRLNEAGQSSIPEYEQASSFLHDRYDQVGSDVKKLLSVQSVQDSSSWYATWGEDIVKEIREIKHRLREFPDDALSWLDLAFHYTVLEQDEKADKCITICNSLAPEHPFVARSISRYLLHHDKPDEAFAVLRRTGLVKTNPMIASAAISISNAFNTGNVHVRSAKRLLDQYKNNDYMLSELAAALGTLEIENGAVRNGKKLLSKALSAPAENAITQYNWLHHKHGIQISINKPGLIKSIEAEATESYVNKEFVKCRQHLMDLHAFQPFSDTSIVAAGYISLVGLEDAQFVVDVSEGRLHWSKMTFTELNNLLVAKIILESNDVDVYFNRLQQKQTSESENEHATFLATSGMYNFHKGRPSDGIFLYEQAIDRLKSAKNDRGVTTAQYFYAKQLKKTNPEKASAIRESALRNAKKLRMYEIADMQENKPNKDSDKDKRPVLYSPIKIK